MSLSKGRYTQPILTTQDHYEVTLKTSHAQPSSIAQLQVHLCGVELRCYLRCIQDDYEITLKASRVRSPQRYRRLSKGHFYEN